MIMKANKERYEINFLEMPLYTFAALYPSMAQMIPMIDELLKDPAYLVRLKDGRIEIGYTEDAWAIH